MLRFAVVGAAKTGSTFLANLLDRQPGIGVLWESSWYDCEVQHCILKANDNAVRNGFPLGSRVTGQYDPLYAQRAEQAFIEWSNRHGCSVVGDKRWDYLWWWPRVSAWYPDLLAIYNVRHPCGVWYSGQTFKNRGIGDIAVRRLLATDTLFRHHSQHGHTWHVLRYEDVAERPLVELRGILRHLELEQEPVLERQEPDPLPDRWYWIRNSVGAPDPQHANRWQQNMTAEEQAHVYRIPGVADYMRRYDYGEVVD